MSAGQPIVAEENVEFVDVSDELRDRIERFVEQLRRELPDAGRTPGGSDA